MKKFNYKYKTIQNIKGIQESNIQREISEIDLVITQLKNEFSQLDMKQKKFMGNNDKLKAKASEMKFKYEYMNYMEELKKNVLAKIDETLEKKAEKQKELIEKSKEKKIFNKIEEKHLEEYKFEENRNENMMLDEVAIQRFSRKK